MFPVLANAGVPMLFFHMPAILAAMLPIIAVETYAAHRLLQRPANRCLFPVTLANAASMLIGFPLLWLGGVAVQLAVGGGGARGLGTWWEKLYAVTVQAPWLIPYESDLFWMIPAAGLFALLPAFFLSVWLERLLLERFWNEEAGALWGFSFRAHCASYVVLVLLWLGYGVFSFAEHGPAKSSQYTESTAGSDPTQDESARDVPPSAPVDRALPRLRTTEQHTVLARITNRAGKDIHQGGAPVAPSNDRTINTATPTQPIP